MCCCCGTGTEIMTHTQKKKIKDEKIYGKKEEGEGMKGIKEQKNEGKVTAFMWRNRTGMTKVGINKRDRKPVRKEEDRCTKGIKKGRDVASQTSDGWSLVSSCPVVQHASQWALAVLRLGFIHCSMSLSQYHGKSSDCGWRRQPQDMNSKCEYGE